MHDLKRRRVTRPRVWRVGGRDQSVDAKERLRVGAFSHLRVIEGISYVSSFSKEVAATDF